MGRKDPSGLMDAIKSINPEADVQLLYKIHVTNQKTFFHLQILYAVFFACLFSIYILFVEIDYSVHSVFAIIVSLLASALFTLEASRSWMISSQFSLDTD
ncbi:MAG: hypothetical protein P1Q69_12470 [Candidatus Thorarchaeota archaeon]|nr:hypothetical protein [Candidatus Thorarchaeota archaeon]